MPHQEPVFVQAVSRRVPRLGEVVDLHGSVPEAREHTLERTRHLSPLVREHGSPEEQHKSLNQVAVEALERAVGVTDGEPAKRRDLTDITGTWVADPQIDAALEDQRRVDPESWE